MGLIFEFLEEFKENLRLRKDKKYAKEQSDAQLEYEIKSILKYQTPSSHVEASKNAVNVDSSPSKVDWLEQPNVMTRSPVENARFVKLNPNGTVDVVNYKGYYWTRLPCNDAVGADSSGMVGKVVRKDGTIDYYNLENGALLSRDVSNRR